MGDSKMLSRSYRRSFDKAKGYNIKKY